MAAEEKCLNSVVEVNRHCHETGNTVSSNGTDGKHGEASELANARLGNVKAFGPNEIPLRYDRFQEKCTWL